MVMSLVTTLIAYGYALIALGSHKGEPVTFDEKYHHVFICNNLLCQLVSSLMLHQHQWVCKSLLHAPINTLMIIRSTLTSSRKDAVTICQVWQITMSQTRGV